MAQVLVTVPNLHWVHTTVASFIVKLMLNSGHQLRLEWPSLKPYENYANTTAMRFVEGPWEFWLSVDNDNPPGLDRNPLDLCAANKDIVGFPTPIYHFTGKTPGERPFYHNGYDWDPLVQAYREHPVKAGLQEVDAVGTGMILFHRRVFEHPDMQRGAFARITDQHGRVETGADLAMCQRAKAAGFHIFCAYDYPCDQFSEISLNEMARAFLEMYQRLGNGPSHA